MIKANLLELVAGTAETSRVWNRLVKAATGTFAIQVASIGLHFIVGVLLARVLGVTGYGIYNYAFACIALLEVPAVFGQKAILVRNVAAYDAQSAWGLMAGLLKWADSMVIFLSATIAFLGVAVTWMLANRLDSQTVSALQMALLLLPWVALTRLRQAALQGLHHIVAAQLPEKVIRPLVLSLLVGCAYFFLQDDLSATWAVGLSNIAMGVAFVVAKRALDLALPAPVKVAAPKYEARLWTHSAIPIMFIVGMNIINGRADILMLGTMKGSAEVAIYSVADRGAQFVVFAMTALSVPLNPIIASLYASGQTKELQHIVTKSTRLVFCVSCLIVAGLTVFGHWFLLLFGRGFTEGYLAMAILNSGQLFTVAMGPVGWLLVMTGKQRDAALVSGITTGLNIILNFLFIPKWGVEGAATATTISTVVGSILLAMMVSKKLQVHSTVVGMRTREKAQ